MNLVEKFLSEKSVKLVQRSRLLSGVLILITAANLSSCSNNEKKPGQALVRVNGEEITVHQLNDELGLADIKSEQHEDAAKRLLESLIDRQLFKEEAMRNKINRTPEVMQKIERAKAKILEDAYIATISEKISGPSSAEISDYFHSHPEYFSKRKQFVIEQLTVATSNFSKELKLFLESSKSINNIKVFLDKHNIRYQQSQLSRYSTELPEQVITNLKDIRKGQLFIISEGDTSFINSISSVKETPVTIKLAAPQIEQYLIKIKSKNAVDAEIARLRSMATIQYLNTLSPATPEQH